MLDSRRPFVLLDDARTSGAVPARLFTDPVEMVVARTADEVEPLLMRLRAAQCGGLYAAGYLAYEAGHVLEPRLAGLANDFANTAPLGWFGLFTDVQRIDAADVPQWLPDGDGAWAGAPVPQVGREAYQAIITQILDYIRAGDIYQANMTFASRVPVMGEALAVYAKLRSAARAGYGGIVATGEQTLLSFSPELFFALRGGEIVARPMKGTATRGRDAQSDAAARQSLQSDPKQRAENLMIVDLIRNDLSRVAVPGSVRVPELFRVETYPTVHQMVSDVVAALRPELDASDILRAIFPCGSITGAPKIRAMEIIDAVEQTPRGIYTGSIGYSAPDGDAAFNVAIRTLVVDEAGALPGQVRHASLGLGSGIVADSDPAAEWRECLAKGAFVTAGARDFDLLETMAFDPVEGLQRLDAHLARMKASAAAFGFAFDRHKARNDLQLVTFREAKPARVRLRLSRRGAMAVEVSAMPDAPSAPVEAVLADLPVAPQDFRLAHKTSDRAFYDDARKAGGAFEVVLVDRDGFVTEGSFTNVFVERDGQLLTPPLSCGLLPGVLRSALLDEGSAVEALLRPDDLRDGFFLGNALRGLMPARLR